MMRDKVNVFYYPSMIADDTTLKKAILLFDELHFIDRPSFMFGNFGTVGTASPLRAYEQSFRDNGVPLYVHYSIDILAAGYRQTGGAGRKIRNPDKNRQEIGRIGIALENALAYSLDVIAGVRRKRYRLRRAKELSDEKDKLP